MGQRWRATAVWMAVLGAALGACRDGGAASPSAGVPAVESGGSGGSAGSSPMPPAGGASGAGHAEDAGAATEPQLDAAIEEPDAASEERDASAQPSYRAPCTASAASVVCEHTLTELPIGASSRNIYWTRPIGEPPAAGFPATIIFQGSLFGPSFTWQELTPDLPFGGFHQGMLHVALLEAGFVVIEPEAEGGIAWQTNAGGDYLASSDHALMLELLERFAESDDFGPIDVARLYATGISSGGYMTSRMAVSYPGEFRALAIQSGSYATCLGPFCAVPSELPSDHPPTLFLHGEADATVPVDTAIAYRDALNAQGIETELMVDTGVGHAWLERAPEAITRWFLAH